MDKPKKASRAIKPKPVKKKSVAKREHPGFDEYLHERLQDPNLALLYLNEALIDSDKRVFLLALKDVVAAQGGDLSTLAKEAQLNRQNLYKMLSAKGNPRWDSITSLFDAMGVQVQLSWRQK